MIEALSKAKPREKFSRAHMAGLFRDAGVDRGNFDIGARGKLWQQIVALKNETESIAPQRRQLHRVERGRLAPVDAVNAGTWPIETAQYIQQRRFAGTRCAHQRDRPARADFEIDVPQRIELLIAQHITPRQAMQLDQRRAHLPAPAAGCSGSPVITVSPSETPSRTSACTKLSSLIRTRLVSTPPPGLSTRTS